MIFRKDIVKITIDDFYEILKNVREKIVMKRRNVILLIPKLQARGNTSNYGY